MSETSPMIASTAILFGTMIGWWLYWDGKQSRKKAIVYISMALVFLTIRNYPDWVLILFTWGVMFCSIGLIKLTVFCHEFDKKRAARKKAEKDHQAQYFQEKEQ